MRVARRALVACGLLLPLAGPARAQARADPASDAPEAQRPPPSQPLPALASYAQALATWRGPEALNDWIGARFEYDMARALALSETARATGNAPAIHAPAAFFERPRGICVDLAHFAVETLRRVAPALKPRYLMIEFDPAQLSGQVLRRHWVAVIERDGQRWMLADSKRPGVMVGPHAGLDTFVADYAAYRGRRIVAVRELDSHRRQLRRAAPRQEGT